MRTNSANDRVTKAALELSPNPSPSLIPAATANTFFKAPPSSIEVTSWLV